MHIEPQPGVPLSSSGGPPWYRLLNRYHWFVLVVAALGWLFDTMDQQLFNLARAPAMRELLAPSPGVAAKKADLDFYGPLATSIFLIGWATGGLAFGVLGDRIGRAKTMLLTILIYSIFTGLSAFSVGFWDFALWRFLTGLGVGGEFAVGVALVAEVMPERARARALGLLQALSAVGNISAALIAIGLGEYEQRGVIGTWELWGFKMSAWRLMFLIGTLPALLAILIRQRLKEPERWQSMAHGGVARQAGSYRELFGFPRWRRHALLGMLLASSGIIGLWGIGFFSFELNRSVLGKVFEQEYREAGEADRDRDFLRTVVRAPKRLDDLPPDPALPSVPLVKPADLLSPTAAPAEQDARAIFATVLELRQEDGPISAETVLALLDQDATGDAPDRRRAQSAADRERRREYLSGEPESTASAKEHAQRIADRVKRHGGRLNVWVGITGILLNSGAFLGIYAFSVITQRTGRKPAFAVSFVLALASTALTFWYLNDIFDVFWMIPLMGFCQLSLFGGYAIYFPELFPTRLRSTGTSFCYNVGRYVAASGPVALGLLTSVVFADHPEPMRPAGVAMCSIFVLGLMVLPFLPETKDQPLPE
jgi:MFS family permease